LEHYPEHYTFKFVEAYYYSEVKAIFKDYIDDLYEKRQNYEKGGKNHLAYVIKYMLNSIYGRFAIKNDTKETHIIEKDKLEDFLNNYPAELVLTQNYKEYSQIISTVPEPSRDLFYKIFKPRVDLASAITALARIHMHELMKKVTVYYTDTDSIVIEEKDLHKLEDYIGPKLGQLKIVNH